MLISLRIEHFAIVDKLELDFSLGMTAFTGETGAGKSIMIDALMLALGGRADGSVVRVGADKCDIQAVFSVHPDSAPALWLKEHDVDVDHEEIILRRVIFSEGRSKSFIQGIAFPLQKVKELSEMLVDIHGQHQHQSLLNHATHRQQLDYYANHPELLQAVQQAYRVCQQLQEQLAEALMAHTHAERMDLLNFQLEELALLHLQEGEVEALHAEHQLLHHAREYLEHTQQALNILEDEETFNIQHSLNQVTHHLGQLPSGQPIIQNSLDLIQNAMIQCEEAISELRTFTNQIQLDPARLLEVEARMSALHQMARKYHIDVGQLYNHHQTLQLELDELQQRLESKQILQEAYGAALQTYQAASQALHASRVRHAIQLSKDITEVIQQLGMPKGYVEVDITPLDKMHAHGQDKVEYKVCTNPGMPADTLAKIASGGELSRISLGIQLITAKRGATPTLIFDEVDVGIGGATAALVGRLLRTLGERLQVFCVTHQPQVASSAHHHFVVEKQVLAEQTYSHIRRLQQDARVEEIARMLGGLTITAQTRSHAKELLTI